MMPSLARLACLALAVAGAAALPMSARKKHTLAETFKSIESDIAALERASASRRTTPVGLERMDGKAESLEDMIESIKGLDAKLAKEFTQLTTLEGTDSTDPGKQLDAAKKLIELLKEKAKTLESEQSFVTELATTVHNTRRDFQRNKEAQINRAVEDERTRLEESLEEKKALAEKVESLETLLEEVETALAASVEALNKAPDSGTQSSTELKPRKLRRK